MTFEELQRSNLRNAHEKTRAAQDAARDAVAEARLRWRRYPEIRRAHSEDFFFEAHSIPGIWTFSTAERCAHNPALHMSQCPHCRKEPIPPPRIPLPGRNWEVL
jgi:hypothetical protein